MSTALSVFQPPKEFRLKGRPQPNEKVEVTYETPKKRETVGSYPASKFNGTILLEVLPEWDPPTFAKLALRMVQFPTEFDLSARPDGSHIVLEFTAKTKKGATFVRKKRIPVNKWDVTQVQDILGWINQAKAQG